MALPARWVADKEGGAARTLSNESSIALAAGTGALAALVYGLWIAGQPLQPIAPDRAPPAAAAGCASGSACGSAPASLVQLREV